MTKYILLIFLTGCSLFVSHYDATRHENFTKLQAFHMKFIDDYTKGSRKNWQVDTVTSSCDNGDLRFREALVYAKSRDDANKSGERAVSNLWEQFLADCELSLKKGKLFSAGWAEQHLEEIVQNYTHAISGELSRVSSPFKRK
ncbi:hypothetical protein QUF74_01080 [Candidatus Halobeggiatoa sp. HSG11]|nr:hypothetical protein [Candidatus Halobeggiatoa sp. HSG11]